LLRILVIWVPFFIFRTLFCVFVFAWTALHCLSEV
jgi:hypothetical protein